MVGMLATNAEVRIWMDAKKVREGWADLPLTMRGMRMQVMMIQTSPRQAMMVMRTFWLVDRPCSRSRGMDMTRMQRSRRMLQEPCRNSWT